MSPELFDALLVKCRLYALECLKSGDEARADYWMAKAAGLMSQLPEEVRQ